MGITMMMLRVLLRVTAVVLLLGSLACAGPPDRQAGGDGSAAGIAAPSSQGHERVHMAAQIAREIQADPENAAAILARHGKTKDEFEALLYEIAAEPNLSRAYNEAVAR